LMCSLKPMRVSEGQRDLEARAGFTVYKDDVCLGLLIGREPLIDSARVSPLRSVTYLGGEEWDVLWTNHILLDGSDGISISRWICERHAALYMSR
jgi:hypothetical protein